MVYAGKALLLKISESQLKLRRLARGILQQIHPGSIAPAHFESNPECGSKNGGRYQVTRYRLPHKDPSRQTLSGASI
jgi:hypothetical protein